jgi:hypothetical protein
MSCAEANRVAAESLKRLGYMIADFAPASVNEPGRITGRRTDTSGSTDDATAVVTCSGEGADIDVVTTRGCAGQIGFPSDFQEAVTKVTERKVERPSLKPKGARTGVQIEVEPKRSGDGDLGVKLDGAGLMAVKVTINNRTARAYTVDTDTIVLVAETGERVKGLAPAAAAQQVAKVTPEAREQAATRLREQGLQSGAIAPNATLTGYLYVPRKAYHRARVMLTDQETEESEGFAVDF